MKQNEMNDINKLDEKTVTISYDTAMSLVNILTYDDYARLYRKLHAAGIDRRPTFEEYAAVTNVKFVIEDLGREVVESGYYFIADLFDDNERYGTPCDTDAVVQRHIDELIDALNKYRR